VREHVGNHAQNLKDDDEYIVETTYYGSLRLHVTLKGVRRRYYR